MVNHNPIRYFVICLRRLPNEANKKKAMVKDRLKVELNLRNSHTSKFQSKFQSNFII